MCSGQIMLLFCAISQFGEDTITRSFGYNLEKPLDNKIGGISRASRGVFEKSKKIKTSRSCAIVPGSERVWQESLTALSYSSSTESS